MEWLTKTCSEYISDLPKIWLAVFPDITKKVPETKYWYGAPCIDPESTPTFDPMLGFPNGRKERKLHMTLQEMEDARIPTEHRNYCAHKYVDSVKCYRDTPYHKRLFKKACEPAWHGYKSCLYDIKILQHKEYERERRLLARQKRRIAKGLEPDPSKIDIAETM